MDIGAVIQTQDKEREDLGLIRKGDILSLRGFCERKMRERSDKETKRQLVTELLNKKKSKQRKTITNRVTESKQPQKMMKTRKVQIEWLHFSDDHQRYISVRLQKGGGTREVDVPLNADIQQIIQIAEEIFFSDGRCIFGALEDMEVVLANFKCETLRISTPEGDPFTLQHYIHQCKTTRVRLNLKSKKKTFPERQASHSGVLDQVVKDDESDLLVPVFPENERELNGDQLLGTSIEREEIRKAQDQKFAQSLALDKRKEEKKRLEVCSEIEKASRQLHLTQARLSRVEPEPDEYESKVDVSVRHPVLGLISRRFHVFSTMAAVYDWVGSLCLTPEQFRLCGFDGKCLLPSSSVQVAERTMLYMSECDNAPNLLVEGDDDVNFQGFGDTYDELSLDGTLPFDSSMPQSSQHLSISPVSVSPPNQLIDEDDPG